MLEAGVLQIIGGRESTRIIRDIHVYCAQPDLDVDFSHKVRQSIAKLVKEDIKKCRTKVRV